jgi:ribose 5-phosphate isomerase B
MRVALAADHGGAGLKDELLARLAKAGHEVMDLGGDGSDPFDDYPDYSRLAGDAVRHGRAERAIVVCGSGVGASVAANKMRGIRAGLAHDTYSAHQGVEHDDMNVLCLGARVIGPELAAEVANAFLGARFSGAERHRRRVAEVIAIEEAESGGSPVEFGAAPAEGAATPDAPGSVQRVVR